MAPYSSNFFAADLAVRPAPKIITRFPSNESFLSSSILFAKCTTVYPEAFNMLGVARNPPIGLIRLYCPYMKPISSCPQPIPTNGMSWSGPTYLANSVAKDWQNRCNSGSDLSIGLKSDPPTAAPKLKPVTALEKMVSKPHEWMMLCVTCGPRCKLPAYGPNADEYWTRKPRFNLLTPASSVHATRNWRYRSGSINVFAANAYFGFRSKIGDNVCMTDVIESM
mmetsp:Transcript_41494/g.99418  ORF Transcript_41494/g.99418 Transcript_41494/m.99418 type:complete len:223 (-) Transcript_41494:440-1108(-)